MAVTHIPEEEAVRSLSQDALWCRTERHNWDWQRDSPVRADNGRMVAFERISVCTRCEAERTKEVSTSTWTVTRSKIRYPVNYLVKGSGRIHAPTVYEEQFRRFTRGTDPLRPDPAL